jgi:hypothetical protein
MSNNPSQRGPDLQLSDAPRVSCEDGKSRLAWRPAPQTGEMFYLVKPGTPISRCPMCKARICRVPLHKDGRTIFCSLDRAVGNPLWDYYAPRHPCPITP